MNVNSLCVNLSAGGTLAVGTVILPIMKIPPDSLGGGITITSAAVASANAIAAGSAPLYTLLTLGTNSAVSGTIATIAEGAFTAGTVKPMTIANAFVDPEGWIAVRVAGTVVNAAQLFTTLSLQYVMGR